NALTTANVTIPDGQTTAQVLVTAVTQNADVTIGAMLGMQVLDAHVRVVGAAELPSTVTLTPSDTAVLANGTVQFKVTLDVPAPVGGTSVGLSETPVHGAFPMNVGVAVNQVSQTFTYTNNGMTGDSTLTATLGASTSTATITVSTGVDHLVINEVEYDQMVNPDSTEFIEIYNPGASAVNLTGKQVLLVNGSGGAVYATIDLTGTLAAKGYLVIAGANVTVTLPATKLDPGWTMDEIQNGGPDGIALVDNTAHTLIDALSYEGAMTMIDLPGFAASVSLVEGVAATAKDDNQAGSMCRSPNGQDTDQADADWKLCATLTPGTANP
ncbi:MAG: lamin tail domain-containing protein, partial [Deltaproteobacteria bacterium]|nr:lamin tail domain-containing protein [Deltaproteobacteria bacterium]